MKKKRVKRRVGDVVAIPLPTGGFGYGRLYNGATVGIYRFVTGSCAGKEKEQRKGVRNRISIRFLTPFLCLANSKWDKLRGWHVFRHSFCSNCAAKGVDQRIINASVGHMSEDMVRRYRHLLPDQQSAAIQAVFS